MKLFTTHFANKISNISFYFAALTLKQFYNTFLFTTSILILSCSIPASFADENVSDVIILFDQSASINEYDPMLISKSWLLTFIKTFEKPYNVFLVGFDDKPHEHTKVTMKNKRDIDSLGDKIKKIKTHGLTTDMEVPLRYLLERDDRHPIAFAVIVSDGEPEIWDEKRWYLSKRIRSDPRYEELNKQYRSLKAQGITYRQIYNRLKGLYHAKNLNLINQRLAKLKEKIGKKLVFLDISGDFKFFKKWAKAANAQYILANARSDEDPVETLRGAIIALQEKTSDILREQLPPDKIEHPDQTEQMEPVPKPKVIEKPAPVTPPQPQISIQPPAAASIKELPPLKTDAIMPDKKEPSKMWLVVLWLFVLLMAAVFLALLLRYIKRPRPQPKGLPPGELTEKTYSKNKFLQCNSIKKTTPTPEKLDIEKDTEKTSKRQTPEQAGDKLKKLSKSSIKDANKFIENEMRMAINDAGEEQVKLLEAEKDRFRFDKRNFMRIPLRPGAMIVHWINKNGERRHGNAINISMHGVMFEAADFNDGRIDTIECPGMGTVFHVKRSRIIRNEAGQVVAALDEFRYNIDDRIKWVETLTRIEEETQ